MNSEQEDEVGNAPKIVGKNQEQKFYGSFSMPAKRIEQHRHP